MTIEPEASADIRTKQSTSSVGDPVTGTPVMEADPLSALDLPLKVLVWDDAGRTSVSYYSPESTIRRHSFPPELAANLRAVDALTDALVSPDV